MWVVRVRGTGNEASGKTAGSARVRVRLFYRALQASSHREGTQMAADFSQLTERVNEAQSEIKATLTKDRDQLQSQVQQVQSKAEHAEAKAEDAIGFAIAAAQEAEYAVLDAALARLDADALAGSS